MALRPRSIARLIITGAAPRTAVALLVAACGAAGPSAVADPSAPTMPGGQGSAASGDSPSPVRVGAPARPDHLLDRDAARDYVLALVNRDRAQQNLPAVTADDTAARAGDVHAADMATHGYTAHVGTDGSVPEQRYTDAGGAGMVMENAGCLADGKDRVLDPHARYSPAELERIESAFMDEVPPNDGHRRNILTAWHTSVGIGLAQTKGLDIPCMAEEFVDGYGDYSALPARAKIGDKASVKGSLRSPAKVAGVGIARIDFPKPVKPGLLNRMHSYAIPKPIATYFPRGFITPIPVEVDGAKFGIDVPLSDGGRPGIYEISVWAALPQTKDLVMVSLRTITVR